MIAHENLFGERHYKIIYENVSAVNDLNAFSFSYVSMRLFHILMIVVFVDAHHQLGVRITVSLLRMNYGLRRPEHESKANFAPENAMITNALQL